MKVTTLACDYCVAVVPAVGTRWLVGDTPSKRKGPSLDLCAAHLAALERAFTRRGRFKSGKGKGKVRLGVEHNLEAVEVKRAGSRELAKKHAGGHPKGGELVPWAAREATVLSLLPASGTVGTQALWAQITRLPKQTSMPMGGYKKVMQRLKAKGVVTQHGSRNRTQYERANGRG